jgi:hypothetical protein
MASVHLRTSLLEKVDMKTLSLHNLAAPTGAVENKTPSTRVAFDILRVVTMAVLAGTAFAMLLALTVLSLTVIAPPAQASGGPFTVIDVPAGSGGIGAVSGSEDAVPTQLADATPHPQAKPTQPPQVAVHEQAYESLKKPKLPVVLFVVLALLAGLLGYFGYTIVKGKS